MQPHTHSCDEENRFVANEIELTREELEFSLPLFFAFTDYLDANGITWFADGGTLLGAIRDQGPIPWDDDFDIYIEQAEANKLHSLQSESLTQLATDSDIFVDIYRKAMVPFYRQEALHLTGDEKNGPSEDILPDFTHWSAYHCHGAVADDFYLIFEYRDKIRYHKAWSYFPDSQRLHRITDVFTEVFYQWQDWDNRDNDALYPAEWMPFANGRVRVMNNYDEWLKGLYGANYMYEYVVCNHRIAEYYHHNHRDKYLILNRQRVEAILRMLPEEKG